ncbi:MAG: hypothetical protein J3Q66DRAFT_424610 [Benniella sp.]|nr:MAG: hypothetical protein J3Q66DRAFT_424610 [Benniella sp.]
MSIQWTPEEPTRLAPYLRHFRSLDAQISEEFDSIMAHLPKTTLLTTLHAHVALASNVGLPCLKKLSVSSYRRDNPNPNWILYHSPNLTDLNIRYHYFEPDSPSKQVFLILLAGLLPRLKRLSVKFSDIKLETAFELLEMCFNHSQLIDLQCDFCCGEYITDPKDFNGYAPRLDALLRSLQDADKAKAEVGQPTGLSLKSLMLPNIWEGYTKDFLVPFLRSHVPNLERFRMPGIHEFTGEPDIQVLAEAISVGCPRLRHSSYSSWYSEEANHEDALIAAIRSCARTGGLKSYIEEGYYEEDYHETGPVIKELLKHHADTLEEIEFQDCHHIYSESIQSIATACKNLRTLIMHPNDEAVMSLKFDYVPTEWVCRDLAVLHLMLDRDVYVPWPEKKVDVVNRAVKGFFAQVGCLSKLEELTLGCKRSSTGKAEQLFANDLTLKDGWLAELAGLKKLWHLRMYTDYWSSMGQEEVEFMDTNWPKLEKISFGWYDFDEEVLEEDHWKWLKKKRPPIDFYNSSRVHGLR